MEPRLRVLELFCGIGGCAAALDNHADIVAAIDIDRHALAAYRANFAHPAHAAEIESLPTSAYGRWRADLWWLSPPCQPYTVRGRRRDVDDPRAASFLAVLRQIESWRPTYVAMENVAGFLGSRAHGLLRATLDRARYAMQERVLCPTELGVPNRRPRFYLIAARSELAPWPTWRLGPRTVADYLDSAPPSDVFISPRLLDAYAPALHRIDPHDPHAIARCFTSAYGKSPVHSGSYLKTGRGERRFTPQEVLRFLGFPEQYRLPPTLSLRRGWALAGNSLSVHAARWVLSAIPPLAGRLAP